MMISMIIIMMIMMMSFGYFNSDNLTLEIVSVDNGNECQSFICHLLTDCDES